MLALRGFGAETDGIVAVGGVHQEGLPYPLGTCRCDRHSDELVERMLAMLGLEAAADWHCGC
jgi:hypothetical protein